MSEPWGYAIVVRTVIQGPLHDDAEKAMTYVRAMEDAAPTDAFFTHSHFERVTTEPDLSEGMGT